jgi:TonB family protein
MRISHFFALLFPAAALLSLTAVAWAQTPSADPGSLLQQAAHLNGLTGDSIQPWHLKVSYKIYSAQGTSRGEGSYEEFYSGPTKYKRSYTSDTFNQSQYGTERGPLQSGDNPRPAWQLDELRADLISPLARLLNQPNAHLEFAPSSADTRCVVLKFPALHPEVSAPGDVTACFDEVNDLLTIDESGRHLNFLNPVDLQSHFLPGDLTLTLKGQVVLSAHLVNFETLHNTDDSAFAPPPDATPPPVAGLYPQKIPIAITTSPAPDDFSTSADAATNPALPRKIDISFGVAQGLLLQKVPVVYPPIAKAMGLQGTVVLRAVISKDGTIKNLRVVSGSPMLQQSAIDAVRQWQYRPYLLMGSPVEVETTVNVVFSLGDPPKK